MQEKILTTRKNGMLVLLLSMLLCGLSIAGFAYGNVLLAQGKNPALFIVSCVLLCVVWIPFLGLKALRPQEALVLTLFGKYIGTIKGDGFYFVNPFCVAVNPAARTIKKP